MKACKRYAKRWIDCLAKCSNASVSAQITVHWLIWCANEHKQKRMQAIYEEKTNLMKYLRIWLLLDVTFKQLNMPHTHAELKNRTRVRVRENDIDLKCNGSSFVLLHIKRINFIWLHSFQLGILMENLENARKCVASNLDLLMCPFTMGRIAWQKGNRALTIICMYSTAYFFAE